MLREVEATFRNVIARELRDYFERVVADWEHKPDFKIELNVTTRGIEIYAYPVGPHARIWRWVSEGTRPYTIRSKTAGIPMTFRTGYRPRTGRGYRYRGPGKSVGPWVSKRSVEHPGIAPREFEKHIRRFYQAKFRKHVENAMRRGARML